MKDEISFYPAIVGDGQSGLEAKDKAFDLALHEFLNILPGGLIPVKRHRGGLIEIDRTLAMDEYKDFPDKERWIVKLNGSEMDS
jgi:hypothetical protein